MRSVVENSNHEDEPKAEHNRTCAPATQRENPQCLGGLPFWRVTQTPPSHTPLETKSTFFTVIAYVTYFERNAWKGLTQNIGQMVV